MYITEQKLVFCRNVYKTTKRGHNRVFCQNVYKTMDDSMKSIV